MFTGGNKMPEILEVRPVAGQYQKECKCGSVSIMRSQCQWKEMSGDRCLRMPGKEKCHTTERIIKIIRWRRTKCSEVKFDLKCWKIIYLLIIICSTVHNSRAVNSDGYEQSLLVAYL